MAIKVLLVEDDRALREALADTLLLAGHDYTAVGSAEEALATVGNEAFSLVISDVNMPGMDGHQLLGLLRTRQPQLPHSSASKIDCLSLPPRFVADSPRRCSRAGSR